MAAKILLAEDDSALRETITEALRTEGAEVIGVGNGMQALEAWDAAADDPPRLVILDALMPKMTGFDCAKLLRQKGTDVPIIFMSGVYKSPAQQEDAKEKYGCVGYFTKPVDAARLAEAVRPYLAGAGASGGTDAEPLPSDGSLLECPPLYLLWRAQREHHTGVLELFGTAGERARIFVYKGRAALAQHSDPQLNVGVELVRAGVIDADSYKQACELAVQRSTGLYDVLKGEGWVTDAQGRAAYKALIPRVLERVVALTGRFRWVASDAFTNIVPASSVPMLDSLLAGLRKATEREIDPHVSPRRPLRLAPGDNWADFAGRLAEGCGSDSLARAINGRANIAQMLEAASSPAERAARFRQVYLLMSTMSVRASMEPIPMAGPPPMPVQAAPATAAAAQAPSPPSSSARDSQRIPVSAAAVAAAAAATPGPAHAGPTSAGSSGNSTLSKPTIDARADRDILFNDEESAARDKIKAKFDALDGTDYYAVLGIKPDASTADAKRAYLLLAREFHTDAFAGKNLGTAQLMLDHIFQVIQLAHSTIADERRRAEYDAKRSFEAAGASTDVAAILQAEAELQKAQLLIERGELGNAAKLLDKVVAIMPGNDEALGLQKYCTWWTTKSAATANDVVKQLEEHFKKQPGALALKEFQGRIWMEVGDVNKATAAFRKVLEVDPNHAATTRAMRALQRKKEEADKKASSGFGKLFKR